MTVTLHKNIPIADNHSIIKYSCASATVRQALVGCAVGQVAEQTDTSPATLWIVVAGGAGTATWSRLDSGAESLGGAVVWSDIFPGAYQILEPALDSPVTGNPVSLLADRSGSGKTATGASSARPLFTAGLNGFAGVASDGVDDELTTTGLNLPFPGTTPYYVFAVFRFLTIVNNASLTGNGDFASSNLVDTPAGGTSMRTLNGSAITVSGVVPTNWNILEIKRSNNSADTFKVGAVTATGNAGNTAVAVGKVFASPGSAPPSAAEFLVLVYTPVLPDWVAVRAAVTSKYGVTVSV